LKEKLADKFMGKRIYKTVLISGIGEGFVTCTMQIQATVKFYNFNPVPCSHGQIYEIRFNVGDHVLLKSEERHQTKLNPKFGAICDGGKD